MKKNSNFCAYLIISNDETPLGFFPLLGEIPKKPSWDFKALFYLFFFIISLVLAFYFILTLSYNLNHDSFPWILN